MKNKNFHTFAKNKPNYPHVFIKNRKKKIGKDFTISIAILWSIPSGH